MKIMNLLPMAIVIGGCIDNAVDESTTAQEISTAGGVTWGGGPHPLGLLSQETCWLDGVSGQFRGTGMYFYSPPGTFNPTLASVYPGSDGHWWVRTQPGIGSGITANVKCINMPYPGVSHEITWSDNQPGGSLPAIAGRHCFLREVWATSGMSDDPTFTSHSRIAVSSANGQWSFSGSFVDNWAADYDFGGGIAICIDYPQTTGTWDATFPGSSKNGSLRNYYPDGPFVPVGNIACGLRGIAGDWDYAGNAKFTDDPMVSPYWQVNVTDGKTGIVHCVQ